jgi:hypothetical protein
MDRMISAVFAIFCSLTLGGHCCRAASPSVKGGITETEKRLQRLDLKAEEIRRSPEPKTLPSQQKELPRARTSSNWEDILKSEAPFKKEASAYLWNGRDWVQLDHPRD